MFAERLLERGLASGNVKYQGIALNLKGTALRCAGRYAEAFDCQNQRIQLLQQSNDRRSLGLSEREKGK